jgi:hypothetical protein
MLFLVYSGEISTDIKKNYPFPTQSPAESMALLICLILPGFQFACLWIHESICTHGGQCLPVVNSILKDTCCFCRPLKHIIVILFQYYKM